MLLIHIISSKHDHEATDREIFRITSGTCQKLAGGEGGGRGGGNLKFGFGNGVIHPWNGSEIC